MRLGKKLILCVGLLSLYLASRAAADPLAGPRSAADPGAAYTKIVDANVSEKNLVDFGVNTGEFFADRAKIFSDGYLYHGTTSSTSFASILTNGANPSTNGHGGGGLYTVPIGQKKFAVKDYAKDDPAWVVKFRVKPAARVVDITRGEGKRVWTDYLGRRGLKYAKDTSLYDQFASDFGIDILRYPYNDAEAYVVKNMGAIGEAEGDLIGLLSFPELLAHVRTESDPHLFLRSLDLNHPTEEQTIRLVNESPLFGKDLAATIQGLSEKDKEKAKRIIDLAISNLEKNHPADTSIQLGILASSPVLKELDDRTFSTRLAGIAQTTLPPREQLGFLRKWEAMYAPPGASFEQQNNFLAAALSFPPRLENEKELAAYYADLIRRMERTDGRWPSLGLLLDRWANHPELLDSYAARAASGEPVISQAVLREDWRKNGAALGRALQGMIQRWVEKGALDKAKVAGMGDLGLADPSWTTDLATLRKLQELSGQVTWGRSTDIPEALLALLLQQADLYKKDHDLLEKVGKSLLAKGVRIDPRLRDKMLGLPELWQHKCLVELALRNESYRAFAPPQARYVPEQDLLVRALRAPEAGTSPEILVGLFRDPSAAWLDLAAKALQSPAWKDHPELLEQLVALGPANSSFFSSDERALDPASLQLKRKIEDLLDLPHWRDHPAFSAYKDGGGKLSYAKVRIHAIQRQAPDRMSFKDKCSVFFGSLGRK